MCQGVIGIVNTKTNQWDWGVGSHTELIADVYGQCKPKFYDSLVRFEAELIKGPGYFYTEGGRADSDLKAQIKTKLLEQAGTPQLLADYINKHGFDSALSNLLLDRHGFCENLKIDKKMIRLNEVLQKKEAALKKAWEVIETKLNKKIKDKFDLVSQSLNETALARIKKRIKKLTNKCKPQEDAIYDLRYKITLVIDKFAEASSKTFDRYEIALNIASAKNEPLIAKATSQERAVQRKAKQEALHYAAQLFLKEWADQAKRIAVWR